MGKRIGIGVGIIIVAGLAFLAWAAFRPGPLAFAGKGVPLAQYSSGKPTGVPADFQGDEMARAKYLAEAADCEACHTADGGKPFAGGRAFVTQFGTLYTPNITADKETGIGDWSDADFLKAVHQGVDKKGQHLYPAFPYASYTYLTDEDVLAIKKYIFSLPAEKNVPPANTLHFPYNIRGLMTIWSWLYNPDTRFQPVANKSASWNRGAYLAEALGHCGECHTPRTLLQSLDNRNKFAGGLSEGWRAYNLTGDKTSGVGSWSADELTNYLKTGHSADRGTAFGPMALAVHLSFQKLTPSDVNAIVEYVQSIPAVATPDLPAPKLEVASAEPSDVASDPHSRGASMFASMCAGCHSWTGKSPNVPHATLTGTRSVNDPSATNVALAILRGASTLPPSEDIATMPSFAQAWSDDDIAAVSNYVVARFGARPSSITASEVHKLREQ